MPAAAAAAAAAAVLLRRAACSSKILFYSQLVGRGRSQLFVGDKGTQGHARGNYEHGLCVRAVLMEIIQFPAEVTFV